MSGPIPIEPRCGWRNFVYTCLHHMRTICTPWLAVHEVVGGETLELFAGPRPEKKSETNMKSNTRHFPRGAARQSTDICWYTSMLFYVWKSRQMDSNWTSKTNDWNRIRCNLIGIAQMPLVFAPSLPYPSLPFAFQAVFSGTLYLFPHTFLQ